MFASTNAVTGPMEAPAITEAATLNPLTPYGSTKAAAEMLMSAYTASYGLRCVVLRLTNVYGPGMQAKDSIVARLMRAIRLGKTFEIYGDGRQVRDYVHAGDVIAAVALGLSSERVARARGDRHRHVAVGARGRRRGASRHRRGAAGPPRPRQAGRDAGRDRRSEPRARRGLVAAVRLRRGLAGVWEEWSQADLDAVAAGRRRRLPEARPVNVATVAKPFALEAELAKLDPGGARRRRGVPGRPPAGAGAPLAIVIPAYNEEPTVAEVVAEIPSEAAGLADRGDRGRRRRQGRDRRAGDRGAARSSATCPSTAARALRCGSATGWRARAARR